MLNKTKLFILKNSMLSKLKLYIVISTLIIISYDSYWFGTSGIGILVTFRNFYAIVLPVVLFLTNHRVLISQNSIGVLFLLSFIFILGCLINDNSFGAPLLIFSGYFTGLALISEYSIKSVAAIFTSIVICISLYTLLIELGCLVGILKLNVVSNIADAVILTSCGCVFFPELGDSLIRTSAIFREPGVFMIFLNISLLFELFLLQRKNRNKYIIVLCVSMLSTFSTGGIICMFLIFIIYNLKSIKNFIQIFIFSIIGFAFVLPFIPTEYIEMVFGKFDTMDSYGSAFARMSSLVIPFHIFLDNPFIGCGFDKFPEDYIEIGYQLFHRFINPKGMSTNTFMNIYAIFGGIVGTFMCFGMYKFSKLFVLNKNTLVSSLIFLSFILMFSNESMPYWPFLYIFILYGINKKIETKICY